jgi:hypothetical protein
LVKVCNRVNAIGAGGPFRFSLAADIGRPSLTHCQRFFRPTPVVAAAIGTIVFSKPLTVPVFGATYLIIAGIGVINPGCLVGIFESPYACFL